MPGLTHLLSFNRLAPGKVNNFSYGGVHLPALRQLIERNEIELDERVVLFNTGSGIKYLEALG